MNELSHYEMEALLYAEKVGIIEYKVEGKWMIWEESYPNEGTYLHKRDLEEGRSLGGILIKKPW